MKKILLVDTNRSAYPVYENLIRSGCEVWVVGGKTTEPLAKISDNYVELDYSDTNMLAELIDQEGFDHIIPGCTDISYQVCSIVASEQYSGIDTPLLNSIINDKASFRALTKKLDISSPAVFSFEEAFHHKKVIVKPVDSFSGKGISVVINPTTSSLNKATEIAKSNSQSGVMIIEEFVEGQLYSFSSFIKGQKVIADFVVQEECSVSPYAVDTSRVDFDFSPKVREQLIDDVNKLSAELCLSDGLVHIQFIRNKDRYWLIEMTRRCPGDLYSLLIEYSTGYPYAKSYMNPFLGKAPIANDELKKEQWIIRHTVSSKAGELLWGMKFNQPLNIRLYVPLATAGDYLDKGPAGRAGILFLENSSKTTQDLLYSTIVSGELYQLN